MLLHMAPLVRESRQVRSEVTGRKLVEDFDGIRRRWRFLRVQMIAAKNPHRDGLSSPLRTGAATL